MRRLAPSLLLAALLVSGAASGIEVEPPPEGFTEDELEGILEGLRGSGLQIPPGVGDEQGMRAVRALRAGRLVQVREMGEQLLADDPDAWFGHCLVGIAQRRAEGNLPRAAYHLERCRELFGERYGEPYDETPWYWHLLATDHLVEINQDMGRQEEALAYIDELDLHYSGDHRAMRGWPLVKLGRYREARALAQAILEDSDDQDARTRAWIALCFLEGELRDTEASYHACRMALEVDPSRGFDPVTFTNAAEAARGVLRMDESEKWLLEATEHFMRGSLAVPWMDLMNMYVDQGRAGEALEAMREMFVWRYRQPPDVDIQNSTYQDVSSASLLLVAGRPVEATRLTARAIDQPDRVGRNSVDPAQLQAATAIVDRAANRTAAELRAEEASWSGFWAGLRAHLDGLRYRIRAWRSGRRLVALLANDRLLSSRFPPHPPGFVRIPEWLDPDITELLGPAVVAAALADAYDRGFVSGANGYAQVFEAEVAALQSRHIAALDLGEEALTRLPRWETLLRARVAARTAVAARETGDEERAAQLLDLVFQLDPGAVRRLGLSVPCRFAASGSAVAQETLKLLRRSPRLEPAAGGFSLSIEERGTGVAACLLGVNGVLIACSQVSPEADEAPVDTARRLAREFHADAFAPRFDLTQADLRSLDGTNAVASGRGDERLRLVLSDLIAGGEAEEGDE